MLRLSVKHLLGALLLAGCGGVTPIARSERAAIGASFLTVDYCMEPGNSAEQVGAPLLLGDGAADTLGPLYGVMAAETSTRGREIAEIMLFARESLYRVCEAQLNGNLEEADAKAERKSIVATTVQLIATLNQHELNRSQQYAARNQEELTQLIGRLLAEIAELDARRNAACAPGDSLCQERRDELRERMANREALLKALKPEKP